MLERFMLENQLFSYHIIYIVCLIIKSYISCVQLSDYTNNNRVLVKFYFYLLTVFIY